jgi:Kef-type K+ transport system membrane component KefB
MLVPDIYYDFLDEVSSSSGLNGTNFTNTTKPVYGIDTMTVLGFVVGITLLLWASWAAGGLIEKIGGPALVGEIFVGMLFGPNGIPIMDKSWRVTGGPLDIIGTAGLIILVYEGGLGTDLRMFKTHGAQVLSLAFTGIIMPVVFAVPVMMGFGFSFLESFTAGTVLCSTAIAFTVRLLQDNDLLKTHKGQLIIISAVIDDIMSLVVLAVLNVIGSHHFSIGKILWPLWTSALIFLLALMSKFVLSRVLADCGEHCLEKYTTPPLVTIFNSVTCAWTLIITYCAELVGSTYLLGTYMAGIVISAVPTAEEAWEDAVSHSIRPWFSRLFFTATVGFAIPLDALVDPGNLLCGFVLTIAAILGKFLTGAWSDLPTAPGYWLLFIQIGSAMVGRGELGFVVAKMALHMELLSQRSFSACIWALLLATILGPFMFQYFLTFDPPPKKTTVSDGKGGYQEVDELDACHGGHRIIHEPTENTSINQTKRNYTTEQGPDI